MSAQEFLDGRVTLHGGDCLAILKTLPSASVDSVVTDPPYHLTSIVKRFGSPTATSKATGALGRSTKGFMGKTWDGGDIAFQVELWEEVLRVLKPGGHLAAFSGTRTYHRMAVAIEDAGFEIRDQLAWTYGSGFPKSHDVSKAIDRMAGAEREIVSAGKPVKRMIPGADQNANGSWIKDNGREFVPTVTAPATDDAREWEGWGTALKPAWEQICLARKALHGTVAENVLEHGVGALNITGCRVETDETIVATRNVALGSSGSGVFGGADKPGVYEQKPGGRFPANLIHDGSPEVLAAFPNAPGQQRSVGPEHGEKASVRVFGDYGARETFSPRGDAGSAARFFYTAKADADDRIGSKHPTVKPVDLMQWLVRLITPKGGLVLDCFAGTGTTGEAAWREGMRALLIEREAEYQADIARRMALATEGQATRRAAMAKLKPADDFGPLFALGLAE
ncbi:DNA-methyltransferase [Aureimonas sp. AU40]|uniref:DNA-methyltransferase n=1 Tax=Aureimonas sp. AU40 TaxID=1637747 RepID=UPI0007805D57|nr:DNA methyltransferase [Aureimonas sp. AU40]